MRRFVFCITLLMLACTLQASSVAFVSKRLRCMAEYLSLQNLDTLKSGVCDTYNYKGHPLTIRVNKIGEIEHIGLKLFAQNLRSTYPSPVYDFLERYLLERNASPSDTEEGTKMQWDKVHFSVGSAATALSLDSTAGFFDNHVDLKVYRVAWMVNDKIVLQMSFDMDYQLMSGCTEIELEENFMRSLSHFDAGEFVSKRSVNFPDKGEEFIRKGDFFISPLIRNDSFYIKKSGEWKLVNSKERASQSIANLMLDANINETIKLDLTMDQYGYKKDTLSTSYRQFIQLCINEGCVPYYGLKEKIDDSYSSTIFLVNRQGGYLHMLSAVIPLSLLEMPDSSIIRGKLYAYIPLFNVSDKILNPQNYKSVSK